MKADRWFYTAAGVFFLITMLVGFRHFVANGAASDGSPLDPAMFRLDLVHGTAIAAWYVLFLIQSLLISIRNRRRHFSLGWSAVAIAAAIAITGPLVATHSVRNAPDFQFFGMQYSRFLLVMYAEIALYVGFVTTAIFTRRKPRIHRAAMLLAGLCLLAGATARMPFLYPVFGAVSLIGLFGPIFCIGAVLLLVRSALTRSLDQWLAAGLGVMVLAFLASEKLALTATWSAMAAALLRP
jgi:hypothetical protein